MKTSRGLRGRTDHIVGILHSSWVKAFGSADAATFVMLINAYQQKLPAKSFVAKSRIDIENETGISARSQFTICKNLKLIDVLETKLVSVDGVSMLHYRIKENVASKLIQSAEKKLDKEFYKRNKSTT